MSRTIITKSGSEFFTNINAEQFLGRLCRDIGGKFFMFKYSKHEDISMAYSMTKKETLYVSEKFRELAEKIDDEYLNKYKCYLDKGSNVKDFKEIIFYYADLFEKSGGYNCVS